MKHPLLPLTLLTALTLASCGNNSKSREVAEARPNAVFNRYKDRFLDSLWYYNPEWASGVGYHRW